MEYLYINRKIRMWVSLLGLLLRIPFIWSPLEVLQVHHSHAFEGRYHIHQ